eukprot:scaffold95139_cov65-Phaeocystis_antarctica.AAC.4
MAELARRIREHRQHVVHVRDCFRLIEALGEEVGELTDRQIKAKSGVRVVDNRRPTSLRLERTRPAIVLDIRQRRTVKLPPGSQAASVALYWRRVKVPVGAGVVHGPAPVQTASPNDLIFLLRPWHVVVERR